MIAIAEASQVIEIDVDGEEILSAFAEVMHEWGHVASPAPKCEPVRFPTLEEARRVAAGMPFSVRGWNVSPLS